MPQFRKKAVVIEAIQLLPNRKSIREVEEFLQGKALDIPAGSTSDERFDDYVDFIIRDGGRKLKTMESQGEYQFAKLTDWIIKGVQGEFYPCDNEVFQKTYESAGVVNVPMIPVDSSAVNAFGYDKKLKVLAVEYSKGGLYHYPDYSFTDFEKLRRAESVGKFVIANVQKLPHVKIS